MESRGFSSESIKRVLKTYRKQVIIVASVIGLVIITLLLYKTSDMGRSGSHIVMDTTEFPFSRKQLAKSITDRATRSKVSEKVYSFYVANNYETQWLGKKAPFKNFSKLDTLLSAAHQYGLYSKTYDLTPMKEKIHELYKSDADENQIIAVDIKVTELFFLFTTHVKDGRNIDPAPPGKVWKVDTKKPSFEDVKLLASLGDNQSPKQVIDEIEPRNQQYIALKERFQHYHTIALKTEGKQELQLQTTVRPGQRNETIPMVRKKLAIEMNEELLPNDENDSLLFDKSLEKMVRAFQTMHGIPATGIIDKTTIKNLNIPWSQKAETLALNMERIRWESGRSEPHFITVNIPEYILRIFKNNKEKTVLNVIVGEPEKATPVFSANMTKVIFSPTWTVPKSIIEEEILPKLQANPEHFEEDSFTFFKDRQAIDPTKEDWDEVEDPSDLTIVQRPGEDNSLGKVKFLIPNNMSIYLHDTPARRLFNNSYRALSHGCVRVQHPEDLAAYVLDNDTEWNSNKIAEAMKKEAPVAARLQEKIPVHFEYFTTWVDRENRLNFRDDVYGYDSYQLKQLKPSINAPLATVK